MRRYPGSTCPSASDDWPPTPPSSRYGTGTTTSRSTRRTNDDRYLLLVTAAEPSCSALANSKDACSRALSAASDLSNSSFGAWSCSAWDISPTRVPPASIRISQTGSLLTVPANANTLYTPSSVVRAEQRGDRAGFGGGLDKLYLRLSDVAPAGAHSGGVHRATTPMPSHRSTRPIRTAGRSPILATPASHSRAPRVTIT